MKLSWFNWKAHDPLTGLLISHFNLVDPVKPEAEMTGKKTEGSEVLSLQSLFDQELAPAGVASSESPDVLANATSQASVPEARQPDVMSMIELNSLTGEIVFKKVVDYEELTNKVHSSADLDQLR